jgi:hypothetical protein
MTDIARRGNSRKGKSVRIRFEGPPISGRTSLLYTVRDLLEQYGLEISHPTEHQLVVHNMPGALIHSEKRIHG